MIPHVNKLLGICYFHIRLLRAIRRSLTVDAAHALVRSLMHSRLDYCNSVLVGLPDYMINRLQSVLRSAARLVLQLPKRSHALERMQAELHWLVYPHRLYYKVGVISYKCLHGLAPPYLSTRLIKVSHVDGRSHLRSASDGQLVIPKSKTKTIGVRGFHISGPTFWNWTIAGQWSDIEDFQGTAKDCTISWCSWEESTARAFAMLITLRGVLTCLINNNNNN